MRNLGLVDLVMFSPEDYMLFMKYMRPISVALPKPFFTHSCHKIFSRMVKEYGVSAFQ